MQIMSHLTLIEHSDQQSSEIEGYLRKLLRPVGGVGVGEVTAVNSRNEHLSANASLSTKSDVIILLLLSDFFLLVITVMVLLT